MTELENFLKQIVLKRVHGTVYLIPAICDFQIEEALKEERKQAEKLNISNVTDFFSFAKYLEENFKYYDNTDSGDVYKGEWGIYTEIDIYEEWSRKRLK